MKKAAGDRKFLFIDRDGTLIKEYPPTYQIDAFEKLRFYPYVFKYLGKIVEELDYALVLVTNQDGLDTDDFPHASFLPPHQLIMETFAGEGIVFKEELIDKSYPKDNLPTRKPGIGLFTHYINNPEVDMANSFVIGDRITDVQLALNLGCKAIWLRNNPHLGATEVKDSLSRLEMAVALATTDWKDIYHFLKAL